MAETLVPQKQECTDMTRSENVRRGTVFNPRVDILENENELILFADLPGVKPDDIDVCFENKQLEIHGKVTPRQSSNNYMQWEYGVGDFHRVFRISEQIDADKITAELKHGVLTVHVPKSEAVKPKRIAVTGAD